jgi:hypothetical protein
MAATPASTRSVEACAYKSAWWPSHLAAWYPLQAVATAIIASTTASAISHSSKRDDVAVSAPCSASLCAISML